MNSATESIRICQSAFATASATLDWSALCNVLSALGTIAAVFVAIYVYYADKRPDIIAFLDVDTDSEMFILSIANFGRSAARSITIEGFDIGFCQPEIKDSVKKTFISRGIPCLAPNGIRQTVIATTKWAVANLADRECSVTVTYGRRGLFGGIKTERETFVLDYYSFANSLFTKSDGHLMRIAVEEIARKIND